jgi:hypothetical protein
VSTSDPSVQPEDQLFDGLVDGEPLDDQLRDTLADD